MNKINYKIPSRLFRALSSETALRIFTLLGKNPDTCVSDIAKRVGLSLSATSHQLQKMESAGLIESCREGRTVCYMIKKSRLTKNLLACVYARVSETSRVH